MRTILILLLAADELSSTRNDHRRCHALSLVVVADQRPLLREFGLGIKRRVRISEGGANRAGQYGAYTSDEIIPCLDMRSGYDSESSVDDDDDDDDDEEGEVAGPSSRGAIRSAFTESGSRGSSSSRACGGGDRESSAAAAAATARHGRSSGSGCTIVRLTGSDASSIRGLMSYATRFFDGVDDGEDDDDDGDDECNSSDVMRNAGVFRIDDHVYAGYDPDVNGEGKMQFLDTRILLPPNNEERSNNVDPILLPLEVGELVGKESLVDAHRGMDILLRIGTQITSAVLGMDSRAAGKLIDDGTRAGRRTTSRRKKSEEQRYESMMKDDVSNSYHRLIRYVRPPDQSSGGDDGGAAFGAHVDSTFLTLIPMPELPGLEVWCPSRDEEDVAAGEGGAKNARRGGGEWVRPTAPLDRRYDDDEGGGGGGDGTTHASCAYVIVLAGEFLQLTSNGRVPVCIHRVVPPKLPPAATGTESGDGGGGGGGGGGDDVPKYKPRVSAPMFLRPRRGEGALLDVGKDLRLVSNFSRTPPSYSTATTTTTTTGDLRSDYERKSLYYEKGLIDECDAMHLWSAHEIMKGK